MDFLEGVSKFLKISATMFDRRRKFWVVERLKLRSNGISSALTSLFSPENCFLHTVINTGLNVIF